MAHSALSTAANIPAALYLMTPQVGFRSTSPVGQVDLALLAACALADAARDSYEVADAEQSKIDDEMIAARSVASQQAIGIRLRAADAAVAEAYKTMCDRINDVCGILPTTLAGYAAVARLIRAIAEPYKNPDESRRDDPSLDYVPQPLIRTLLQNLATAS